MVLMKFLFESWRKFIKEDAEIPSFEIHRELNRNFWLQPDDELDPKIKDRLLEIVKDFMDQNEISDVEIRDITFTGSLANYNYSKYSDIDLHIVVNFAEVNANTELVKEYFNARKALWNYLHDIFIKEHEVEIYVQDEDEEHISTGIYSLLTDEWIETPTSEIKDIDHINIKKKAYSLMDQIDRAYKLFNDGKYKEAVDRAEMLKKKIRKFRIAGLEDDGEYSIENLAFKALRATDYLKKLSDLKRDSYDKTMSMKENK